MTKAHKGDATQVGPGDIQDRIDAANWSAIAAALDADGFAVLPALLSPLACADMVRRYDDPAQFRSRIVMSRHGFGLGEYQYFAYPLPNVVASLRVALYRHLAPIANRWFERLRLGTQFPDTLETFIARCHEAGQLRPTPLLLRYGPGDYNCLHQDVYGATLFPLQVAIALSRPGAGGSAESHTGDFSGGEFLLVEQRPRMQSRGSVVPLAQGDAVIFPVSHRPVAGAKGDYRVTMRHGVSRIRSGSRHTLGVIFHDAT